MKKEGNKKSFFYNFFKEIEKDKLLLFLPLGSILVRLIIFLVVPLTYEDSYITFRYAENFADGNGLVYNLGEKVYGTTTPLFALLVGLFNFIGISSIFAALFLNLIVEGIVTIIIYNILKNSDKHLAAILSILYILSPSNISWSVQGMETAFFSGIIALAFYFFYKQNYSFSLFFAFLSSCIRIDGLSAVAVLTLSVFFVCRIKTFKLLIFPSIIFLGWLLFLYLYYGNVLPNSMIAKLILYSGHQTSSIPNLQLIISKFITTGFYSSSIMTFFFLVGSVLLIKNRSRLIPLFIWFFVYYSSLVISKTWIHPWYLIPPLFAYITISALGIHKIYTLIMNKWFRLKKGMIIGLIVGLLIFSTFSVYQKMKQMAEEYRYYSVIRVKLGLYLNSNTEKASTILLEPIGIIGYFAERYIYDEAALISPIFLELNKLPFNPYNRYKKIELVSPDYVVLRHSELEQFYSETNLLQEYDPLESFPFDPLPADAGFVGFTIFQRKGI